MRTSTIILCAALFIVGTLASTFNSAAGGIGGGASGIGLQTVSYGKIDTGNSAAISVSGSSTFTVANEGNIRIDVTVQNATFPQCGLSSYTELCVRNIGLGKNFACTGLAPLLANGLSYMGDAPSGSQWSVVLTDCGASVASVSGVVTSVFQAAAVF